jgi:hypothetical protein
MTAASAALVGRELALLYLRHLVARNDSAKLRCLPVVVLANEATGVARTFITFYMSQFKRNLREQASRKKGQIALPNGDFESHGSLKTTALCSMTAGSLEQRFPPTLIIGVPIDRRFKAFFEIVKRFPLQLALRER